MTSDNRFFLTTWYKKSLHQKILQMTIKFNPYQIIYFKNYLIWKSPPQGIFWPHQPKVINKMGVLKVIEAVATKNHFYEPASEYLKETPEHLKTQEMCDEAVRIHPAAFFFIPDHIKTQSMCDGAACIEPYLLASVPNCFKAAKMCDKAVRKECFSLFFLSDWFVTEQQVNYGMITMICMIIDLLSDTKAIRNGRLKKP